MKFFVPNLLTTLAMALSGTSLMAAPPFDPAQFDSLHALIKPNADEQLWTRIPWMTSLWQARQRAAQEGKPILLWEMDGHPLGCT